MPECRSNCNSKSRRVDRVCRCYALVRPKNRGKYTKRISFRGQNRTKISKKSCICTSAPVFLPLKSKKQVGKIAFVWRKSEEDYSFS